MAEIKLNKYSFDRIKARSDKISEPKLFAIITGIRGQGKSYSIGTLNLPTLLITSTMDYHSIASAKIKGLQNITSIFYDVDEDGRQLKADAAINELHNTLDWIINSDEVLQNCSAIALDSISIVDKILQETSKVLLNPGFAAINIIEQEHFKILKKLNDIYRKGFHVIATMPIMGDLDENNLYTTVKPELRGVTTTSTVTGVFGEVLLTVKLGVNNYAFQMDTLFKKTGKAVNGSDKTVIFKPRIAGLSDEDLILAGGESLLLPADLNYIYQLKLAKFNSQQL